MSEEALDSALAALVDPVTAGLDIARPVGAARDPAAVRSALTDYDNQLILDLVARLRPPRDVLQRYGLSVDDLVAKARNPEWAARFREQSALWNSDVNLKERIRAKAAYLLEDSLVPLFAIISTPGASYASKLEAIEKLIKISTVANVPKDAPETAGGRQIAIHFGGAQPRQVTIVSETADERTAIGILPAQTAGD